MKKRVLLINPPQTFYKGSLEFNVFFPLGLLSIATLVEHDCTISLYDCLVSDYVVKERKDSTTYGASDKDITRAISRFRPDIVGIGSPFTSQRRNVIRVAKLVKSYSKKTLVVVGGPDSSVAGKDILLTNKSIDICAQGEGEYVFQQIIRQFHDSRLHDPQRIPGLYYRTRGRVKYSGVNKPILKLDELPFPKYDLVRFDDYLRNPLLYSNRSSISQQSISVITSRGCPYNCIFCSVSLHMSRVYRAYSPEYVLRHLRLLIDRYHIRNFHFEDDNLTLHKDRFEKILDGIIENGWDIKWDTPNGVRADTLNYRLLVKMKKSGCVDLTIAVESGSQRVLDEIVSKRLDIHQTEKVADWCRVLHIPLWAFFIIGFPGEKIFEMQQTLDYALYLNRHYDVKPYMFIATPLYGTRLYNVAVANHYLTHPLTEKLLSQGTQLHGQHLIATPDFSTGDIDRLGHSYETKLRRMKKIKEWAGYRNRYNGLSVRLKKIIKRYVYDSDGRLFLPLVSVYIRLESQASSVIKYIVRSFRLTRLSS